MAPASSSIRASSSVVKAGPFTGRDVLVELLRTRGSDQRGGHDGRAQCPLQRELRERLAATLCDLVERAQRLDGLLCEPALGQRAALLRTLGRAVSEVLVGEQPLRQRREGDRPEARLLERVGQSVFDPAVEDRVRRLVDDERCAEVLRDRDGFCVRSALYDEMPT